MRRHASDVGIQRQTARIGGGFRNRKARAEDRICAQLALVVRIVERDHRVIDVALVLGVHADQQVGNRLVDGFDSVQHALAQVTVLVAIAQLDRFMRARRSARWHCGPPETAVFEQDVHLDRGVAPAVQYLASVNVDDGGHARFVSVKWLCIDELRHLADQGVFVAAQYAQEHTRASRVAIVKAGSIGPSHAR